MASHIDNRERSDVASPRGYRCVVMGDHHRRRAHAVTAVGLAFVVASCSGSTSPDVGTVPQHSRTGVVSVRSGTSLVPKTGKTACDLITPAVIRAADFTYRVVRQTKVSRVDKNGASACSYGDDPDPTHISSNFLALLVMTPAALSAKHATAASAARTIASPCPANAVHQLGANSGIGSYAYFCVKPQHAPSGGWIQDGNAYLLEVGGPNVVYGTARQRAIEFESVATAIARNARR
jgi:hypothetical protein